jgi:hypothetical protein
VEEAEEVQKSDLIFNYVDLVKRGFDDWEVRVI